MPDLSSPHYKTNNVSNTAVEKGTGKNWPQWFAIFDAAGAEKLDHKSIVAIAATHGAGPWWQQMVTVGYEQARGLRKKNERADGYELSVSKTLPASAKSLYDFWAIPAKRAKWFTGPEFEITTKTPVKSIRIKWIADNSRVNVAFYPKPNQKCSMVVQHGKLKTQSAADTMRKFWASQLESFVKVTTKNE